MDIESLEEMEVFMNFFVKTELGRKISIRVKGKGFTDMPNAAVAKFWDGGELKLFSFTKEDVGVESDMMGADVVGCILGTVCGAVMGMGLSLGGMLSNVVIPIGMIVGGFVGYKIGLYLKEKDVFDVLVEKERIRRYHEDQDELSKVKGE